MTLAEAVAVLSRFRHRGWGDWFAYVEEPPGPAVLAAFTVRDGDSLTEFEAVAVAEKYLREAGPAEAG